MANDNLNVTDLFFPEDPGDTIRVTTSGDIRLLDGLDNFKGAIRRRGMADPGHMVHRFEYGMGLIAKIELPRTNSNKAQMSNGARRNALQDPRSKDASVSIEDGNGGDASRSGVTVSLKIRVRGQEQIETVSFRLE